MGYSVQDGWHTVKGIRVYVEDNKVIKGIRADGKEGHPHHYDARENKWTDMAGKVPYKTFIDAVRRDTYRILRCSTARTVTVASSTSC